jgi:hypothetical protein
MNTKKQFLLECLKERYEYEQFRRNNFDNQIGLPVTIVALLVAGLAALALPTDVSSITKLGSLICFIPLGISIFNLAKVFYGADRKYDVLPTGKSIDEHYQKILTYCDQVKAANDSSSTKTDPEDILQGDFINWYIKCNEVNCDVNDLRAEAFHKSKKWLIWSLFGMFILVCIHVISTIYYEQQQPTSSTANTTATQKGTK